MNPHRALAMYLAIINDDIPHEFIASYREETFRWRLTPTKEVRP